MAAPKSPEFRRRALDLVAQGEPVAATARNLGISELCLRRWMSQEEVDRGDREGLSTTERRELVELNRLRFDAASFRVWKEDRHHAKEDPGGHQAACCAVGP
jgi:transposase-like protein